MEMTQDTIVTILGAAGGLGVRPEAMADVLHRAAAHFWEEHPPTTEGLQTWLTGLKTGDGAHLFHAPAPGPVVRLSAEERLTRGRPAPPDKRKAPAVVLSAAALAELATMPLTERMTRYRELQAQGTTRT